jgi:hypothetical protein
MSESGAAAPGFLVARFSPPLEDRVFFIFRSHAATAERLALYFELELGERKKR